ncbi:UDP-N-acetyl-D-glucosamine 2-epimerase, UDP-hydrolysing [Candidatus Kaiserbacteria bacterium RIFCSPHIGHO2_02_FULL_59_21]|uniref:UDP-N-acetylglucosamine 2-epimerase n=2 Tax=Candidatus Kaiseribacteriota TaxID=1752734 RepID=A0A0G1YUN5_9BACT|nr:MAG: UDP-N-acetylglucosamine 2-epimerase [Candidatus Kaiserbacteria bacterium GW2011_GWA2_58_9]OGG62762.1 MAG: UDP-N-acetyl-D-glucosamine 2-epimerase, UDP-hydrolysing [Candidatus Kaiserbacteria bacterium RIFCSPHIGHO2_01_FULL_58_22]OGG67150.1 MAG: UDP-N-acetyl-D-glucosamine 2-epimerase, UDP-hydrolysing [Candidatus Kaiserbacteria bacterium RIFCSPHIGHO2_02_FULL_59_21]OGG79039.1 MAG: UDP-N-acetyl-D-glucosamine 2-epimerase, UDP-hydrolysing [Candidatus Kaiserbacteria bacterium RIFCSPLOWO2_01_FULL_5
MSLKKKNVLVVTGTRAEYGLLRSTMDAIRAHKSLRLKLLVTGMHTLRTYGHTANEIKKDGYQIDSLVPVKEKSDMLQALMQEIAGIRNYCLRSRPDCVLVLGDRDEPFAAAIVAGHLNIPLAHIHGGDVSGPTVDESIRHAITKFAHLHFPATTKSAARIRSLAEESRRIFPLGSVAADMVLNEKRFSRAAVAKVLHLDAERPWLILLQHPSAFESVPLKKQISSTTSALKAFQYHEKIVIYPNTDTGNEVFIHEMHRLRKFGYRVFKSLPRLLFMSAVAESDTLIGNSSAGIIETSYLGTPTVNVGDRQRGRERGPSVIDVPYDPEQIAAAIKRVIILKKSRKGKPFPSPYGKAGVGKRIASTLARELQNHALLNKHFIRS